MDDESGGGQGRFVTIRLEPPVRMAGPMGTAIISEVPSYRVHCEDSGDAVFCILARLARHLAAFGMTEACIRDALAKAQALEDPGDLIEVEIF
jgi:hypothetical protein